MACRYDETEALLLRTIHIYPKLVVRLLRYLQDHFSLFSFVFEAFNWLNNQEGGQKEAKEDAKMKNSIVQIGKGNISRPNDRFGFTCLWAISSSCV